jgi:hypothetical protein
MFATLSIAWALGAALAAKPAAPSTPDAATAAATTDARECLRAMLTVVRKWENMDMRERIRDCKK